MSRLKAIFAPLALIATTATLTPTCALAAVSLIVVNENSRLGDSVVEVYVSPTEATGWGPNRLRASIPPGDYAEIDLHGPSAIKSANST